MEPFIYLDNSATTPVDPRVLEAMLPYFTEFYGNASSSHAFGAIAHEAVKTARAQVADLIGCEPNEIIFTSGATEAINLALKGLAEMYGDQKRHIVTVQTEHMAVLETCRYLETRGFEVTYLPVQSDGLLDLDVVKTHIRKDTLVVSVMLVNNETGVIQPIEEIAEMAHAQGSFFMSDATQAVGKIPVDVNTMGIDLMPISAHKFYGPKGVGALYVRSRRPRKVKLVPLIHGGGHERGLRSGTVNVAGVIGFGKAAELSKTYMHQNYRNTYLIRTKIENLLLSTENSYINGNTMSRIHNISNICFKDTDASALILSLKNISVSNGSSCSSSVIHPSHVLKAMGLNEDDIFSSIRISIGIFDSNFDTDIFCEMILSMVTKQRMMLSSQ